jgi:Domain of unknown function (DUF4048)
MADILAQDSPTLVPSQFEERRRSQSPKRNTRHTKGLSLNFPILLPTQHSSTVNSTATASPTNSSTTASPHLKAGSIPSTQDSIQSPIRTSTDFLTLVAAQERKVLELREELAKADAELTALKKQWAIYEAGKKREEVRQVRRMTVPLDEVPSPVLVDEKDLEEERRRRRALVEMTNNTNGQAQPTHAKVGRRGSKRVFEGRHTRTLSLLSPVSAKHPQSEGQSSIDELTLPTTEDLASDQDNASPLSRMPTFDGLISPANLQLGFGKTYKNLAAHRRSLPPATADLFMKQSKQVVDGVREGLWTFFEDIRQATVGDEAVNGPVTQQRPPKSTRNPSRATRTKTKSSKSGSSFDPGSKDDSFWKEFGLDTPRKAEQPSDETRNGHAQQKSSTDSQNPPDLLQDIHGENDDHWDHWESPTNTRNELRNDAVPMDNEGLPWPELKKLTPGKSTRTASDLMCEWRSGEEPTAKDTELPA